jgi:MoaA/NifB/PqqE/SkfB family radical SAM enzyme
MRCHFCYYQNDVRARRRDRDLTTDQCKRLMDYHRRCGMDVLELTGGEPTIRKDLLELIDYARRTARFRAVSIITNGVRLADAAFAQEVARAGVSDFLFSLQGSTEAVHDKVTGLPGSFRRLLKAIENLLSAGAKVRCNSVITGENLPDVRDRAALLGHLGVPVVNFILFNPIEQADQADEKNFLRYTEAARPLRDVIQRHGPALRKLTIRYMPFCVMPDCLEHLQNVHQVHYDHDEWNYYQRAKVRERRWKWLAGVAYGMAVLPGKSVWRRRGSEQYRHAAILEADSRLKKLRPPACRRCRFGFICGGVWRQYARRFGDGELTAQAGKLLLDPWHFMPAAHRATPPWLQPSPQASPGKSPAA